MSSPPPARRILVVCLGNWCRSPMAAAAIARHGGPRVEVRSAGLAGKHAGQPAHPAMITAAAALGYDLAGHRAQQVTSGLLRWADVILWTPASSPACSPAMTSPRCTCTCPARASGPTRAINLGVWRERHWVQLV